MVLALFLAAVLFISCSEPQYDNPNDEKSTNYGVFPSSSGEVEASSSSNEGVEVSSSSSEAEISSSSGEETSSSSTASTETSSSSAAAETSSSSATEPSSSSDEPSSSATAPSSSSEEPSSSATTPSSSATAPSSSATAPSSSATAPSSSSEEPSSSSHAIVYGQSVIYGGETYETVVIGNQTWFARNLNYADYECLGDESKGVCYGNDPQNCADYGRLYSYGEVTSCGTRAFCPTGWHLPNDNDWNTLMRYFLDEDDLNNLGPSTSEEDWVRIFNKVRSGLGWNTSDGFAALPGGMVIVTEHETAPVSIGYSGNWWSSTWKEDNGNYTLSYFTINDFSAGMLEITTTYLLSIRCIKDN